MAVTQTTRFSLYRWSDGGDAFTRAQMDTSHANVESLAAIYGQGLFSARPAAGTVGRFFYATDTTAFYYDDGVAWRDVSSPDTVLLTATQTLTNKTLTTPKIASILTNAGAATLTLPTSTDTLVGRATTDTLTGKTMSGASNTFSAIPQSAITSLGTDLGLKAPLASPTFTGTVSVSGAPPAVDTNTTQVATTAWVMNQGYLKSASYTASDVLTKIKTVDGTGSGLDADTLDGNEATAFSLSGHNHSATYQPLDGDLTAIAAIADGGVGYLRKDAANTWSLDNLTLATDNTVVHLAGVETITGQKTFTAASTGFSNSGTNGVSLVITGNGATTPTKSIRVKAGVLEFLNDAGTTAVFSMTDAGAVTLSSTIAASGLAGSLLSSANPLMNGSVGPGNSTIPARDNHIHPVDTSRSPLAGSSSITTVGTIASGTWNGSVVAGQYGGTGVANTGKTITLGGNLTTTGGFTTEITVTGNTSVTLPTTGTLVNTAVTTLSSLTSVGTIGTGTWQGSVVAGQYGGTGVNNSGKTITLGGNFTTSGAFATTLTVTALTNVTLPTSGTLVNTAVTTLSSLASVGTVTSGTWSASFGAVSGANLTNLTAGNLSGTIPSAVLGNSSVYIGTTAVALNRGSAALTLAGITLTTPTINNGLLLAPRESVSVVASAATGTIGIYADTAQTYYYTTNASGNFTLNFRHNAGTTLDSVMTTGQSITFSFLNTNGVTPYYCSAIQVDGSTPTVKWMYATPTAGNASSIDSYTFTVVKTGAGAFTVFATLAKFV